MKKTMIMLLSAMMLTAMLSVQTANAQNKKPDWPGVTIKVLVDNDNVNISEVTFAPGAVADWHSHPQHTIYAITDMKLQVEEKGKETKVNDVKAGQAIWSPAVTHKTTNVGTTPMTAIVTEIKEVPHKH